MSIFVGTSFLLHAGILWLGGHWIWRPPVFDMVVEPPPVVIQLSEIKEPPPPEAPMPEPEPEIPPEDPPPEPEIMEPEPEPEPEPVAPEPEVVEEAPAEIVQIVDQPTYLRNPAPPYPHEARRNGWEGTVLLRINVQADGRPSIVEIVRGSGHPVLDDAAVRTLRRWKFSPARLAGQPVSATVEIPISFKLKHTERQR